MKKHSSLFLTVFSAHFTFWIIYGFLGNTFFVYGAQKIDEPVTFDTLFNSDGAHRTEYMARHYFDIYLEVAADRTTFLNKKNKHSGKVILALLHLWKATGDVSYLEKGKELFESLLSFAPKTPDIYEDCFGFFLAIEPGAILKRAGHFDPKWQTSYYELVSAGMDRLSKSIPRSDGNQDLARLAAMACASSLYPQDPKFSKARISCENTWQEIMKRGDLRVDSKTYAPVAFQYLIALAVELGRLDELMANEGIHRQLKNYATLISPNGFLPEFGHAYFHKGDMEEWLWMMEIAAGLYKDPSILEPAKKLYVQNARHGITIPNGPMVTQSMEFLFSSLIHPKKIFLFSAVIDRCLSSASTPVELSTVTYRSTDSKKDVPEFLILRTGLQPGDAMLMMDLLSSGDHCHQEFRSSIAYYESKHVPLFWQYGRHKGSAVDGNLVLMKSPAIEFPGGEWPKNTWRTVVVPMERFSGVGHNKIISSIGLRTFIDNNSITIDNIRLVGAAGEKKVLDFESASEPWRGKNKSRVEDATSGKYGLKIDLNNAAGGSGVLDLSVNLEEYSVLLMDIKWDGTKRPKVQLRPSDLNETWVHCEDDIMFTEVKSAHVEMKDKDSFGEIFFCNYGTTDTKMTRRIVLTKEGYLFIRDDLTPGKTANGMDAGSLWQMYSLEESGQNWFNSRGELPSFSANPKDAQSYSQGMLAWFSGPKEQSFGKMAVKDGKSARTPHAKENWKNTDWNVVWSNQKLVAGKNTYFNLAVIPHAPQDNASQIASGISSDHDDTATTFRYKQGGKNVTVFLSKKSEWSVSR